MAKKTNPTHQEKLTARAATAVEAINDALKQQYGEEGYGNQTYIRQDLGAKARELGLALIEDLFGVDHRRYHEFLADMENFHEPGVERAKGTLDAIHTMVKDDWMSRTTALVAGSVFNDYLEMAEHLSDESYKDAAAVIAGSALEAHLKRLARGKGVPLTQADGKGIQRPKKADTISADLVKEKVYDKNEQKQVIAWLGTRNDAAHGDYDKVHPDVVKLMIQAVRSFITRYPA